MANLSWWDKGVTWKEYLAVVLMAAGLLTWAVVTHVERERPALTPPSPITAPEFKQRAPIEGLAKATWIKLGVIKEGDFTYALSASNTTPRRFSIELLNKHTEAVYATYLEETDEWVDVYLYTVLPTDNVDNYRPGTLTPGQIRMLRIALSRLPK